MASKNSSDETNYSVVKRRSRENRTPRRKPYGKLSGPAYKEAERQIADALQSGATELDLSIYGLTRVPPLSGLTALQSLYLMGTKVSDLAPLSGLTALQSLYLMGTKVSDLAPLSGFTALQSLYLTDTQVSDLAPLSGLTALQSLDLTDTQVSDLTPLSGLTALQSLYLTDTQVSDLAPLSGLTALQLLDLRNTQVSDLAPLSGLTALQSLDLRNTLVSDLAPLSGLTALQSLDLRNTLVSDLAPLSGLTALQSLDLRDTQVSDLTPLSGLTALQSLELMGTQVSDLTPLSGLTALQSLELRNTQVSDLALLSGLTALQSLYLTGTKVSDLAPLSGLTALQSLDLMGTQVSDLTPLSGLTALRSLELSGTQVSDLTPLSGLTALVDRVDQGRSRGVARSIGGLAFDRCPLSDPQLLTFSKLQNPDRTEKTINYLRTQQGLPPYVSDEERDDSKSPLEDAPEAIENVPAPFDFEQTRSGTITLAGSDTNIPAFPFATSREDHGQRLEACRVLAGDLVKALSERRYDNVRGEFLSYLQRYHDRLPQSSERGNMLLADGMARSLAKLFAAEAEILPAGFATELHTLLEQHIAACVYYPEIGAFNRDVRDGKPSRPFPLQAAEAFSRAVQAHTPKVFEPPVALALSEARAAPPSLPEIPADTPRPSPKTLVPPAIPGGEIDPRKSREFATAATANCLWRRVHIAASVTTVAAGVSTAAQDLAPYAHELIQWLAEVLKSLPTISG